ncbi:MAG: LacI family DNA-binding transcriptional regulator [Chloroflexi bacterium]|nr:LacI family DNA-binding transcriptional regulator [Chloroflexota bacterium]
MKPTIRDIAERAGVSKTSVSFAFNDPSRLPQETVQRILAVADELGYMPNPLARSMTSKRTGNLGMLFPQPLQEILKNLYTLELLRGVGHVCDEHGYNLVLVSPLLGSMRHAVSHAVVDGFLTIGLEHYKSTVLLLDKREIPYVMVDSEPYVGAACVNIDDSAGAYEAMYHVLANGHRRIAILGIQSGKHGHFEEYVGTIAYRVQGYRRALNEFGLDIDQKTVRLVECPCTQAGGYQAMKQLARWKPTAVVAMADIIAAGAIDAAVELGIQVPAQLSIVGYDDLPLARWLNPPLTTVAQPTFEKAQYATRLLLEIMDGKSAEKEHMFATQLVERASVARVAPQ